MKKNWLSIFATLVSIIAVTCSVIVKINNSYLQHVLDAQKINLKKQYYTLNRRINSQQVKLEAYNNSRGYWDFWDSYQKVWAIEQSLGFKFLRNMGFSEIVLNIKYGNKTGGVYNESQSLFKKEKLGNKSHPEISYPAGTFLLATRMLLQTNLFIVKYQQTAKALNIKGWKEFVANNKIISSRINVLLRGLDLLLSEINKVSPVMINNKKIYYDIKKQHLNKKQLLQQYDILMSMMNENMVLLTGNMYKLIIDNIVYK